MYPFLFNDELCAPFPTDPLLGATPPRLWGEIDQLKNQSSDHGLLGFSIIRCFSSGLPFCSLRLPFLPSLTWDLLAHPRTLRPSSAPHPRAGGGHGRPGTECPHLSAPISLTHPCWNSKGGSSHTCSGSQPVSLSPTSPWDGSSSLPACSVIRHL